jgi:hypothetical protein
MPFKIALTPTYKVKVFVEIPNDKGSVDKSDFLAEFKRVDMKELEALRAVEGQDNVLREVLVGWSGLLDADNAEVPYNPATLEGFLLIPAAQLATVNAFWKSIFKAGEKN